MSLTADKVFFDALKGDDQLMDAIGGRLYSTAIPLPDDDADNVPVPYVIVTFDGLSNDAQSKDDYEGDYDLVNIGVEIAAADRASLGALAGMVRRSVHDYIAGEEDEVILDYSFTAQGVNFDSLKPCFWQKLVYQCDTYI